MPWPFENLRMTLRLGRDLARQVEAALAWINTVALPEDRILVEFPAYRRAGLPRSYAPREINGK